MGYSIKHKANGKFFSGFEAGPEFAVVWSDLENARWWMHREQAESQALLLRSGGHNVQIKPVALRDK
jgi:hypothetical protein